ncbi:MAG TPA: deoxyguanosinetriphosphate triphosphohydrolase [Candidatus Subteraquimicrobiales bacterium]
MNIREQFELEEKDNLSPFAALSANSRGRKVQEESSPLRTCFQRDRDRIIHTKAFRRLSHKTQVFLAPEGDHYRTRLTHTLEVSQISRTIAQALKLNQDLTEAIALSHDLGHTPFGHIGEEALSEVFEKARPKYPSLPQFFDHNEQSLRVVDVIEYNGKGLNLSWEVRDGILTHTGDKMPATLEGEIVRIADRIAYINHDIDDALRGGIISQENLPQDLIKILGKYHGHRVNAMVMDLIENSWNKKHISMSERIGQATTELRSFLFAEVYQNKVAKGESPKAKKVLQDLFLYYLEKPEALPEEFKSGKPEEIPLKVCDYVAGMTDRFAIRKYEEIFVPRAWTI